MKRVLLGSTFFVFMCLLVLSSWLLVNPQTASAASGSADCGGGWKVQCCYPCTTVTKCDCTDGVGCTVTYNDGSTREKRCDSFGGGGFAMEEGPVS